jgi:hypothetical protein
MNFQHGGVLIQGKFSATAAGVTVGTIFGEGFTVVRSGVGLFTVTTRDPYRHVIAFGADLGVTTPIADIQAHCGIPGGGAGAVVTMTIQLTTSVPAALDPPNANDEVSFWMLLSNNQNDAVR